MIYLDSAATTLQKPPAVARAMAAAMGRMASPGRGGYPAAMAAADPSFACREAAARLFHVPEPDRVVLTMNATHGLNLAIKTLVSPGDTVLISGYEHNAVTRPLAAIPNVAVKVADAPLFRPEAMVERFRALLTPEVSCVICTHVSNVFGCVLPVGEIAGLCRQRGVPFVLDASQSAGVWAERVALSRRQRVNKSFFIVWCVGFYANGGRRKRRPPLCKVNNRVNGFSFPSVVAIRACRKRRSSWREPAFCTSCRSRSDPSC